jgi:hypothetical protein
VDKLKANQIILTIHISLPLQMRLKKSLVFIIPACLVLTLVMLGYLHDSNVVKKSFQKYTGVKEFIMKVDYLDNHQSYFEAVISTTDKEMLLKKFKFENTLDCLKGHLKPTFIIEKPGYVYYIIEHTLGPYGYILFALEKEGNEIVFYELFSD